MVISFARSLCDRSVALDEGDAGRPWLGEEHGPCRARSGSSLSTGVEAAAAMTGYPRPAEDSGVFELRDVLGVAE